MNNKNNNLIATQQQIIDLGISQKNATIYLTYLQSCAVNSKETIKTTYKTYFDNMKLFFRYLKQYEGNKYILSEQTLKDFTEIWERYCNYCYERGNNKRTLANKRTAISTFYDWCVKRKKIKYNPFMYIDKIRITESDKRRESYFLTPQQIWEINYVMNKDTKNFDLQDKLLFNLFLDSGARISEIHSLKLEQLNFHDMIFDNVRLKEGYIESLIFFENTKHMLEDWIEERKEKDIDNEYLFLTFYNKKYNKMTKETIRARIKKIGKIIGIDSFYPHSIRKTILNITGQQNEQIAAALGHHKDTKVTRKHYMKQKRLVDVRNALEEIRINSGL